MARRRRPSVLVVDGDRANAARIAVLLEEAGIVVTAVTDGAAALAAAGRRRYDLAIVGTGLPGASGGIDLAAEIRVRRPGLEVLLLAEAAFGGPAPAREPRRFVGRVRERLLCAERALDEPGGEDTAELCIAAAKLACLCRRRQAARDAGAQPLAEALRREIAATAAQRRALLWRTTNLAAAHRAAASRRAARR